MTLVVGTTGDEQISIAAATGSTASGSQVRRPKSVAGTAPSHAADPAAEKVKGEGKNSP